MTDAELMAVLNERDRLRVELEEVRRQLLPHPDAKDGEDRGCGCDMYDAVTAAAWASAEIKRLEVELEQQRQLNLQLAERLAACSQVLGRAAEKSRVRGCQEQGGVR